MATKYILVQTPAGDFQRLYVPSGLTTPMLSWGVAEVRPIWIEGDDLGGAPSGAAGGELGGTYPNPTVDASHGGGTHAAAQAAAEATAAAALGGHTGDTTDAHDASAVSVSPTVAGEADAQAALEALEAAIGGGGHSEDHDHDGAPTQKLAQANTHETPDTDTGPTSLHHTLGTGANQAAAGNHGHPHGEGRPTAAYVLPGHTIVSMPAAATLGSGNRYYQPILVREEIELTGLIAEVVAGNGASRAMRGGLYAANELWQPGALVKEGAFDASTTGVKTIAVSPSIVLPPGRYVSVMETNDAVPTWRIWATNPWWATTGANGMIRHLQVSGTTYGALPDPGTAWDAFLAGTTPTNHRVLLRVDV